MLKLIRNEYYADPESPVWMSFGTRVAGNARMQSEIHSFLSRNDIYPSHVIIPQQTHSTTIHEVTTDTIDAPVHSTDGLITILPQVVLTVRTADCVPVIYVDSAAHIIGISHQGWRGTLHNMMQKMIQAMRQRGAQDISIYIGPCISGRSYSVLQDRVDAFSGTYPQFRSQILTLRDQKWHLDIGLLNQLQAEEAGSASVERLDACTYLQPGQFYSFRHKGADLDGQLLHTVMLRS
jgi:YfiH family protein